MEQFAYTLVYNELRQLELAQISDGNQNQFVLPSTSQEQRKMAISVWVYELESNCDSKTFQ